MLLFAPASRVDHHLGLRRIKVCRIQFLGNLDCASTSITLTAAHHVVLAEQSWIPSDEDQSIARVWRTGQTHPVSVVKFVLENSLDERMQRAQDRKREFIARVLDGEEP